DTFLKTFAEFELTPSEEANWYRDRQALIIGRGVHEQFGWKVGDRVTINPSVPPYTPMQFNIVAVGNERQDPINNFFHREYLTEELRNAGFAGERADVVSFFYVKAGSREDLDIYKREIDAQFANSPDATVTQDEKAFAMQFITQQFDLPKNLRILSFVTVFVAIMAAANTMSMNFRDRFAEYATLKSLGFPGQTISALVQFESLLLCGIGAVCGAAIPWLAFHASPLRHVTVPLIQHLDIQIVTCGWAIVIGLVIGVLAGLAPSFMALRLRVVNALRMLE
ncbi:MAG: ABC transporter permease, partial [Deltaproteobacteria bacterium]|nr:ABC transporter permease [Deltaproteobacteria bacterium]